MTSYTDKAWDGSASRFGSTEAYCRSCLIDENAAGADKVQAKCHLPVHEPDGTVNTNALSSALAALHGGRGGGVQASAQSKAKALAAIKRLQAGAPKKASA